MEKVVKAARLMNGGKACVDELGIHDLADAASYILAVGLAVPDTLYIPSPKLKMENLHWISTLKSLHWMSSMKNLCRISSPFS